MKALLTTLAMLVCTGLASANVTVTGTGATDNLTLDLNGIVTAGVPGTAGDEAAGSGSGCTPFFEEPAGTSGWLFLNSAICARTVLMSVRLSGCRDAGDAGSTAVAGVATVILGLTPPDFMRSRAPQT